MFLDAPAVQTGRAIPIQDFTADLKLGIHKGFAKGTTALHDAGDYI
jgi:hypothetical protein